MIARLCCIFTIGVELYMKPIAVFALLMLVPLAEVYAELLDDRWYISPMGTYVQPDSGRHAKEGYGLYLGLGKIIDENWNIEFKGTYDELSRAKKFGGGKWHQSGVGLDALYFISRNDFSPYGLVGLSAVRNSVPGESNTNFAAEVGLGVMYQLNIFGAALRSDIRYRYDDDTETQPGAGNFNDLIFNLGFSIPIGDAPEASSSNR